MACLLEKMVEKMGFDVQYILCVLEMVLRPLFFPIKHKEMKKLFHGTPLMD